VTTPIAVVTGFLGSGKTTLVNQMLRDPRLAGTAVIVNEFGAIALDHDLIESSDESLLRLSTGCLCCAVRTDLSATLLDLAARRAGGEIAYDRVLVETSGLADPAPILHALMTDPALADTHAIATVLTVVDSLLGERALAAHPEAGRQVAFADRILVSKTDLVPLTQALQTAIAAHGEAPVTTWLGDPLALFAPAPHAVPADFVARHGPGMAACLIRRTAPVPALAITLLLETLAEHCGDKLLRVKGLFDLTEAPGTPAVVHAVQHVIAPVTFLPAWPGADRTSRAVVIGTAIPAHLPARLLDAICLEVADARGAR
jgi:G3E family GTPase